MEIKKLWNDPIFDVFFGDNGWHDWARVERVKENGEYHFKQIKGSKIPQHVWKSIKYRLTPKDKHA